MHITERNGSYRITISCGRDDNGKQILRTATFTPPKGLSKRQEQRTVNEFAEDFERKVKGGANIKYMKMTFKGFCSSPSKTNAIHNLPFQHRVFYDYVSNIPHP